MPGYYTYYINVWDEHLKQLHSHGEFKTQQAARQAALAQLEDSGLPYKRADVNIMHYNGADYNTIERHVFLKVLKELGIDAAAKYKEIMQEAEQRYKERYPNRK